MFQVSRRDIILYSPSVGEFARACAVVELFSFRNGRENKHLPPPVSSAISFASSLLIFPESLSLRQNQNYVRRNRTEQNNTNFVAGTVRRVRRAIFHRGKAKCRVPDDIGSEIEI